MEAPARSAVVVGAGPAGLVAAIALRRAGIDTVVCERLAATSDAGSGLTLWPNAMQALDHVGAADAVRRVGAPCDGISMQNARGRVLDRTPRALLEERFGGTGAALHRGELLEALADVLGPGVVRFGAACVGVEQDAELASVALDDGTRLEADVVIGADGIGSLVRRALFGACALRYAGYPVWRAVTPFELAGAERTGTLTLGRGAQFGLFPMTRGRVYWFAALDAAEGTAASGAAAPGTTRSAACSRPPATRRSSRATCTSSSRSRAGAGVASRSSATPPTRAPRPSARAPARRSRTPSCSCTASAGTGASTPRSPTSSGAGSGAPIEPSARLTC